MLRHFLTCIGVLTIVAFSVATASADFLTVVDVGVPTGFTVSQGHDINENGDIIVQTGSTTNSYLYSGGTWTNLTNLSSSYNYAYPRGINDSKVVVGASKNSSNVLHAFKWTSGGGMVDLGSLGGAAKESRAFDVNTDGVIVGDTIPAAGGSYKHAFYIPVGGSMTDIGCLTGDTASCALAINDNGQIAGYSTVVSGGTTYYHAFRYSGGTMSALSPLDSTENAWTNAYGINAAGVVVGYSHLTVGTSKVQHSCLWKADGTPVDIGGLSTTISALSLAESINDYGQVVGQAMIDNGTYHAYIYTETDGIIDLNTLIDPSSGWVLNYAKGINNSGEIVGWGTHTIGGTAYTRAFTMTVPVPEPSTLALLACGLIGLLAYAWRKRK